MLNPGINNIVPHIGTINSAPPLISTSFTVNFNSGYIKGLAGTTEAARTVVITYKATVTEAAKSNKPATNTARLTYSHTPTVVKHVDKTTKTYTFELNNNFTKVDENGVALQGAEFELARDVNFSEIVDTATSDAKGNIAFNGLDAMTYYLREKTAPSGYQLNDTVYTVVISAEYDNSGVPTVTVSITDPNNNVGTDHVNIQNTKLNKLPSTGGIGTTIFTVVGCLIMIAAAAMFFVSRRRTEK